MSRYHIGASRLLAACGVIFLLPHPSGAGVRAVIDPDTPPPEGATVVWSPLVNAVWDEAMRFRGRALAGVSPENPVIEWLRGTTWDAASVMPPGGFAARAGAATAEFQAELAEEARRVLGADFQPPPTADMPYNIIAQGTLVRDLDFSRGFHRSRQVPLEFRGSDGVARQVAFFGTAGAASGDFDGNVEVLDYQDAGREFILRVATAREKEHVVIHMPAKLDGIRQSHQRVREAERSLAALPQGHGQPVTLHAGDVLKIPYVRLVMDEDLGRELNGSLRFVGEDLPWRIGTAGIHVRFDLTEKGARVRAVARVDLEPFGEPPSPPEPPKPRNFICDRPFFIHLWREGAHWPYLSVLVDGGDALVEFQTD